MCRLAGIISKAPHAEPSLLRMRDALRHGGPDDAGLYTDPENGVYLGHRRLSILDLSEAGHQPMTDAETDSVLIYNGELYNFREIRQQLEASGQVFRTQTDTEVVLKAFKAWGNACLDKFNGIFALALYRRREGKVLLARDPAGVKPLYYSLQGKEFCFASEVRAFRALKPDWPADPDWQTYFLSFGFIPEPMTTLSGVRMLPAGHLLEYDIASCTLTMTARERPEVPESAPQTYEAAKTAVREALQKAVQRQMISDAPIGLFLSGGIDSSILTIAAAEVSKTQLHTVGVRFEEPDYDEGRYQDLIAEHTGVRHEHFTIGRQDFTDSLDDYLHAMDQPCNDGINTYFIARYAHRAGLKAALSGIGADEWFGGYPSFQRYHLLAQLRKIPQAGLRAAQRLHADRLRKPAFLALDGPTGDYLFLRGLFTPRQVAQMSGQSEAAVWQQLQNLPIPPGLTPGSGPEYISRLEQAYYQQNQLLREADVMGMWHALEIRVPFLDKEFLRTLELIPPAWRLSERKPKQLLVEAFQETLPRAIWDRPKRGFTFPFARWFREAGLFSDLPQLAALYRQFLDGRLHWSRLWVAYISQTYQ